MKYPKCDIYEIIYKRYFKRNQLELINNVKINKNDAVIDLCGGNGRLTKELVKLSNNVSYLDQESDMIPLYLKDLKVTIYNMSIKDFIDNPKEYDRVFCEQAINYWLLDIDINKFSKIVKKDGYFVFNTFHNKPSTKPMIKEYEIDNLKYIEISYLVNNKIYHVQICEGYEPHFTTFDYIEPAKFEKILKPYFNINVINDNKTDIYVCRRK